MARTRARRKVEIEYDAKTRSAVAAIRGLQEISDRTHRAIQKGFAGITSIAELGVGAFAAVQGLEALGRGLESVVRKTIELRGPNDDLVQSYTAVTGAAGTFQAALGTIILGAAESALGGDKLADSIKGLAGEILDAESQAGRFARDGLSGIITVGEAAVVTVARIGQGFTVLVDAIGLASDQLANWLLVLENRSAVGNLEDIKRELDGLAGTLVRTGELGQLIDSPLIGGRQVIPPTGEELANLGLPADIATRSQTEALQIIEARGSELLRLMEITSGGFGDAIAGQQADIDAELLSLIDHAQSWENIIDGVEGGADRLRAALGQTFTLPEVVGGGADDPMSTVAGLAAIDRLLTRIAHGTGAVATDLAELFGGTGKPTDATSSVRQQIEDLLGAKGKANEQRIGQAKGGGEFSGIEQALASTVDGMQSVWAGGLDSMQTALIGFATGAEGTFAQFGQSLAATLGQTLSQIGIAMLTGGAAAGPFGVPLILLGTGFSVAAALLGKAGGGGGGGGGARAAATAAGIRPAIGGPDGGDIHYHVHAGIAFWTRESLRRGVGELVAEGRELGEIP